jgi:hypothetical protein
MEVRMRVRVEARMWVEVRVGLGMVQGRRMKVGMRVVWG